MSGRAAFERQAWAAAHELLSGTDQDLDAADLERLATTACLTGSDDESDEMWVRAHHEYLIAGEPTAAARCAFWLGIRLLLRGEGAQGSGWFARGRRLIDECGLDCVEQGYLLLDKAIAAVSGLGDPRDGYAIFSNICHLADRFGDRDLATFGQLGRGQALVRAGDVARGLALVDEAMVAVTTGEVSAITAGIVYCAALGECNVTCDVRRAHEWTAAFSRWFASQPDLVAYRGQCLVHRAEIMRLHGDWPDAVREAARACERLDRHPAGALAFYELGELQRLRGDFAGADRAFREASRRGFDPQPGLALLRLAQGALDVAAAVIRRAVEEATDRHTRARLLGPYVETMLHAGDAAAARAAADELTAIAEEIDMPMLYAMSAYASGAVRLAEHDAVAACRDLRRAWMAWRDLEAPYEAARARVLVGVATRALGDEETAIMEFDAARWVFDHLGAAPDTAAVEALSQPERTSSHGSLTGRENEVLRLVAGGRSNKEIAATLIISEHTVRRHLQNIFGKLGVSSRAAATAYAFRRALV